MNEEIKVGYFIMKPVETQEQCDQYSAMATQLNAHNSVAAPGDALWTINENEWKKHIPAGRFGTPEEVADHVGFLAYPASSYITGEVISINGVLYT